MSVTLQTIDELKARFPKPHFCGWQVANKIDEPTRDVDFWARVQVTLTGDWTYIQHVGDTPEATLDRIKQIPVLKEEADYKTCVCGHEPHQHRGWPMRTDACKVKKCDCEGFDSRK